VPFGGGMAYIEREIRRLVGKAIHNYRLIEDGDLVAYDTDMIGPFGYCADVDHV